MIMAVCGNSSIVGNVMIQAVWVYNIGSTGNVGNVGNTCYAGNVGNEDDIGDYGNVCLLPESTLKI